MMNFDITDQQSYLKLEIIESLRMVTDPELNINIIDLGLVYDVRIDETSKLITVEMTLSSRFCPMGESIVADVKNCIEQHFENYKTEVAIVWEPVWSYDSITEEGKRLLGL